MKTCRVLPYVLLLALLLQYGNAFSQAQSRNFRTISVDKGLSQSTVYTIIQDTLGFIWMGTQEGLNRYDGETFTVYHPVEGDPQSLQSGFIKSTFIDHKGQLWIGGDRGVSRYDYASDKFVNYQHSRKPGDWFISAIAEGNDHKIWVGSSVGELFVLNPASGKMSSFNMEGVAMGIKYIYKILNFHGDLYFATNLGLFKLPAGQADLQRINIGSYSSTSLNDIFVDGTFFWIATESNGLLRYDTETKQIVQYQHQPGAAQSIVDNTVRALNKDGEGNIWVGTFRGLSVLNPQSGAIDNYYHHATNPYTISQNSVRVIYRDKQQGMWLGTFYGGVNYYHRHDIKFNLLNQNTGKTSLNDQVIDVIKEDAKGNFWIGTNDKGLNYWDRKAGTVKYYSYREDGGQGLSSNNLKAIEYDNSGHILLGTHNAGLDILDPATGNVKVFRYKENDAASLSGDMVYSLLKDHQSRIWVGTRSGLDQFYPEKNNFRRIYIDAAGKRLTSDELTFLMEDSRHRIWIGTTNGVNQFYPDQMLFAGFPGTTLSNEVVNCIAEDQQKRIWIGTRDGLNLFDETGKTFITPKQRPDFLKGAIYGILPDDEGNLWISTNRGLARFNPDTRNLQWFDIKDGLQNNQFNSYAAFKAQDGMMLFGGINGISYFYPSAIKQYPLKLHVAFTGLEVLNKPVAVNDGSGVLDQHIDAAGELQFKHDQRQFTIYFNTFNYISANRTRYLYRLKGFDVVWQHTDNIPKASYSNLQPGSYVLEVKAIGPDGESSPVRTLAISVLPPWYNTWWFYLISLIVLAIAGYVAFRMVVERLQALQQLKIERMERDKVNSINKIKMDFFTNVSHELRTPLTLILAPLEQLMNKPVADKQLNKQFKMMFYNAKRLYHLVDQLFEFRKTEMGTRKLKVGGGDMVSFIHEVYASFKILSDRNEIRYQYVSTEPKLTFLFDKDAIERIMFNLLSNAFKYTPKGGEIRIELSKIDNSAVIKITDNGKGIEQVHLDKIFDRFYQVNGGEMNLGSGVGLAFTRQLVELHHGTIQVESAYGHGSTFMVKIPMDEQLYRNDVEAANKVYDLSITQTEQEWEVLPEFDTDEPEEQLNEAEQVTDQLVKDRERLLIVDDNYDIVSYLTQAFSANYDVLTAYDGAQALKVLEEHPADLIICDVMMPELDGLHFCKRVKKNIQTCHIPVVLLTAKTETSQQVKGLEMGADDYITKPFSITILEAKVQNILRSRKRLKEYYSSSTEVVPENIALNTLDEEFLKQAISIIEANLSEPDFSVDKFSREIGMSRSNLYLKLRAITGESATDFIKRIRFKKAVEFMQTKQYTIAQVAYMSGFNSPSYFSTAFKQYYDCMPTEYLAREEAKKSDV
ncbi:signal transduction histidine kinase [Mucilaginibacter yixingensis]|uniref:histidine kinase n=1 Tax=Mucilaginibacter yixingensis TaxID=1295612 RepID=A0A2T5J620_9SPHI|nr:hybrid sensor histidine kinase/response regulator transcription factor [Mucilaginibacter yixingensis]PTQ93983.1 signal transduction histidine kinase [Mucilaginibacter yixingensis]